MARREYQNPSIYVYESAAGPIVRHCAPRVLLLILVLLFSTAPAFAASRWKRIWQWSCAALIAGQAADIASSYGHFESNPLLRGPDGRFGPRGMAIKVGVTGGVVLTQWLILRRYPKYASVLAGINFGAAAVTTTVAIGNWRKE